MSTEWVHFLIVFVGVNMILLIAYAFDHESRFPALRTDQVVDSNRRHRLVTNRRQS